MGVIRRLPVAAFTMAIAVLPAIAAAQAPPANAGRPYFVIGAAIENKATGTYDCSNGNAGCVYPRIRVPALVVGAGVPIMKHLSLEALVEWPTMPAEGDIAWRWSYTAPVTNNIASHRDVPVLLLARLEPGCVGGICFEPVAGAGFAIHHVSNVVVSECGSVGAPASCVPPGPTTRTPGTETESVLKFAWAVGLNVRIRLADRVWLQPGARLTFIADGDELWAENFRAPNTGSPVSGSFSVTIMVR